MKTTPFEELARLDRLTHDPSRLAILTALSACERAEFLFLQQITGLTKGNLSSHLAVLEEAGLVEIEKRFVGRKTQTLARLSGLGGEAVESYWKEMTALHKRVTRWRPSPALAPS